MSQKTPQHARPLSPHLQVYKLPLTAKLSILHRLTGLVLSLSVVLMVYWLFSLAFIPQAAIMIYELFSSNMGKAALIFVSFSFFYHFSNGIRHLIWDTGKGLTKESMKVSNIFVLASSVILTAITWYLGA